MKVYGSSDIKCRLCLDPLTSNNKCEAHIFPIGLLKEMSGDEYGQLLIVGTDMNKKKRAPVGSYDTGILCNDCDNKFGDYDNYALEFVKMNNHIDHPTGVGWTISGVDQIKLKLFCMSYLWRASITTRPEFNGVSLGPKHEGILRTLLVDGNMGTTNEYTTVFSKFTSSTNKGAGILFPARTRINKLTYYEAYLPNFYKFWVKVDSQDDPVISNLSLGDQSDTFVHNRGDFDTSLEKSIMVRAAKNSN